MQTLNCVLFLYHCLKFSKPHLCLEEAMTCTVHVHGKSTLRLLQIHSRLQAQLHPKQKLEIMIRYPITFVSVGKFAF